MLTFRCTQRARKRFNLELQEGPPSSTGVLGDWYVNLLNLGRERLVLAVSERSLLPVLIPARNDQFPSRFPEYLFQILLLTGIPDRVASVEAEGSKENVFARTESRSVLGVMNDMAHMASYYRGEKDLPAMALWLGRSPFSPIDSSPDRETRRLFGMGTGRAKRLTT